MALRVKVCHLGDVVDEQIRAFQVRGVTWPVIVTRVGGELYACPGVCPHEDVALYNGDLEGTQIRCPGHSYLFDLKTGACRHDRELTLRRYPITIVDDEIWVDLL
jgi:nitrite reductase/ring-hydroxylating ferredoxin subunit